jgi:predicted RNase H-like HicB family nuclease/predicted RNA binding protein YcfA (HicA-like mRNA interferase family)
MVPLTVRQMIAVVEREGSRMARQRGSHRQFVHPDRPGVVTIAGKPGADLPIGTERAILRHRPDRRCQVSDPRRYVIVIEQADDGGYGAWAPDLPGCVALGDTIEETEREMRSAIAFHIDGLRLNGDPVPAPSGVAVALVEVDAA